jgi:hypothetical protein
MKKIVLFAFAISMLASINSFADICIPTDADYDEADCIAQGFTPGTASGIGAGPGGGTASSGVPIDGGLSIMLAVGGALGARRAFSKRKKENA